MTKNAGLLVLLCALLTAAPTTAFSDVEFSDLDLSPENHLLYRATVDLPRFGSYHTLFLAELPTKEMRQLTFFPEKATYIADSHQLQIQNRYGVFRSDSDLDNMAPIELFPSFAGGQEISTGKIMPIQASPDGRYLVFTRPTSAAYGKLVLFDQTRGSEHVISEKVELALQEPRTLWSPDSRFFVYETSGSLYYFSLRQYTEGNILTESLRRIDSGSISSACWGRDNDLYYIVRTLVYRIHATEFFTKTLYAELFKAGKIVGKIPFGFDNNFDRFWISPDGAKILLSKDGRNLFLYYLRAEDFSQGAVKSLPYLYLPRNTRIEKVIWTQSDTVTLLAASIIRGEQRATLYRLRIGENGPPCAFEQQDEGTFGGMTLSPSEAQLAVLEEDRVTLYDYDAWTKRREISFTDPISVLWIDETSLIIAGRYTTKLFDLTSGASRLLALSQAQEFGFGQDYQTVCCKTDGSSYGRGLTDIVWEPASGYSVRAPSQASSSYRVYLEVSNRGSYRNLIMLRNIRGYGTVPLFPPEEIEFEKFPETDDPVDFANFNHGSRVRLREIALAFNVTQTIEGLTAILNVLAEYGLKCTFFVNGEAIRRYPDAVEEIAESGHEVGSLFYTYFDMTDVSLKINKEFIKLGLARTEDDYYAATGREVSLLWHAPYYFVNSDIVDASLEMNYTHVGRDVDSMDWMTRETAVVSPGAFMSASELVERILEKKRPGSIVPILVGIPQGSRNDYLFQKLDLLINGLMKRGYRIVPVSTLIEHAR